MMDSTFVSELTDALKKISTRHTVGEQWIRVDGTIPAGGLPFCGQLVSRALYADLWAWVQAQDRVKTEEDWQELASANGNNCVYYSDGDGKTTFRLPRFIGYLKCAEAASKSGSYVPEGLPNITGKFGQAYDTEGGFHAKYPRAYGAFTYGDSVTSSCTWQNYGDAKQLAFDASGSNAIYGNSAHVTPETNNILVGVYAVAVYENVGKLDAPALQTEVAAVQTEVAAIPRPNSYVTETWVSEDKDNWYRKYSDGWIEQGGVYKATSMIGTVTYAKAFSNYSYALSITPRNYGTDIRAPAFILREPTYFTYYNVMGNQAPATTGDVTWLACGR